jgi:lipopolysaccharide transport system ATP-binding protein
VLQAAITASSLSKRYRLGHGGAGYDTLREALVRAARGSLRRLQPSAPPALTSDGVHWALRDVSFEVPQGQVTGIIGRNGAGKSTLLKILSRVTPPTTGVAAVAGRVGALLEVGTGFHPELTGRENIFLNGAILGMSRNDVRRRLDEIIAFAELDTFIDTPVKRYSSGMYMRLAFAVAAHVEPDILIIDEVLAVGDAEFQRKCLTRMNTVSGEGRTVLFVSHNLTAVQKMCGRAIWLDQGRIAEDGHATAVAQHYLSRVSTQRTAREWEDPATAPGSDCVRIRAARVCAGSDGIIDVATPIVLQFDYWNLDPDARLNLSVVVYNEEGVALFNTVPAREPDWHGRAFPKGLFRSECVIPGGLLNNGVHHVELYVVRNQATVLSRHEDILVFDVLDSPELRGAWFGKWVGVVRPDLEWRTQLLEQVPAESAHVED